MAYQSPLQQRQPEIFYFAFGSNLHLGQMAKRCPESRYIGTAKLHDYRFQINERGYANVLPSPGNCVEGLVYLLNPTDEARLDKSEGVPTAYQKQILAIEVVTAKIDYVGRAVPELAQRLDGLDPHVVPLETFTKSRDFRRDSLYDLHLPVYQEERSRPPARKESRSLSRGRTKHDTHNQAWADERTDTQAGYDGSRRLHIDSTSGQATEALVYLSEDYVRDDRPRPEYIDRMNAGIIDARKLGMSDMYIETCLRNYIKDRDLPNQGPPFSQQRIPEIQSHRARQSGHLEDRLSKKTVAPTIYHRVREQPKISKRDEAWDTEYDPRQEQGRYDGFSRFYD